MTLPNKSIDLTALNALPRYWIDDPVLLQELIDTLGTCQVVALDTEFIKRTTYYPILALIQVNTGTAVYLIDAPKLGLTAFWQALTQVPVMVWYACGEDLGIFYLLTDCPPLTNVFDVQIGIAYLSGERQMGYAQAIQTVLGMTLDKGESQSDWLIRPLSDKQAHYADADVRYLLALYEVIKDELQQKNLLPFVQEDCTLYAKELHTAQHLSDETLYLEFLAPNYRHQQVAVLQALIMWREKLARTKNEPRTFIIGKQPLREIVETLPTTLKALSATTLNRRALRLYGQDIISIIKRTLSLPKDHYPPMPAPTYTSKRKPFKSALEKAINQESTRLGVPPSLLLKGRHINELLYIVYQNAPTETLCDGLKGYRHDWVVKTVLPLLFEYHQDIKAGFLAPA